MSYRPGAMVLVYADGSVVKIGDRIRDQDGVVFEVVGMAMPRHEASSGRVEVKNLTEGWTQEFFPHVFDMKWVPGLRAVNGYGSFGAEYQGWANWETWNVALYLMNEESLYRRMLEMKHGLAKRGKKVPPEMAERFARIIFPLGTMDMQMEAQRVSGQSDSDWREHNGDFYLLTVNWSEIADMINELE
jgi:hypothetical protein